MKIRHNLCNSSKVPAAIMICVCICSSALAHVDNFPSIHDTVAEIKKRLLAEQPHERLLKLRASELHDLISNQEREILAEGHIRFTVNVPVIVSVIRDKELGDEPFWIQERGFEPTGYEVGIDAETFDVWQKPFHAGRIGLGLNSFFGSEDHYIIGVEPQSKATTLEITDIYPGQCRMGRLEIGANVYTDWEDKIVSLPKELEGMQFIRPVGLWRTRFQMLNFFRETRFPSTERPDQITLTWSDDPQTTQTIQWRTSNDVDKGYVRYTKKADFNQFDPIRPKKDKAQTVELETLNIINDTSCNRHTVTLRGLEPDTTYIYSVGDGSKDGWSELAEFTTSPDRTVPFSFIYMGDAQNGLDRWGTLVHNAFRERPDAKFYIMAGDIVNRGMERWDWDDFFYNAEGIYDRRTLVPVIGNHECQGGYPGLYLDLFTLRENGPSTIEPERAYSFEYSNALFVILDSNLPPGPQAGWLDEQLSKSEATWKFVVYHHPAYSSKASRDNKELRDTWSPIFDKYHVDMALQGHDHAYLRTYPMKDQKRVGSAKEGTIYIVSVSGVKMYDQDEREYTEFGMTNVATYQVLDIQIVGDRLVYRAYDVDGKLRDEIVIEK